MQGYLPPGSMCIQVSTLLEILQVIEILPIDESTSPVSTLLEILPLMLGGFLGF